MGRKDGGEDKKKSKSAPWALSVSAGVYKNGEGKIEEDNEEGAGVETDESKSDPGAVETDGRRAATRRRGKENRERNKKKDK